MKKFNIRVYGILINDEKQVLVSDESRFGIEFTKFPGGGLEFGEGISDCLKREFHEELNLEIKVEQLFYLTDFFQVSAFNENDQIVSVYHLVSCKNWEEISVYSEKTFSKEQENHRWIELKNISELDFTFPIDKHVAKKLKQEFS
jgi:ADP-ribose pyrophosphatase YjhB (NUDIX family)